MKQKRYQYYSKDGILIMESEVLRHALPVSLRMLGSLSDYIEEDEVEVKFKLYFGHYIDVTINGKSYVIKCPYVGFDNYDKKDWLFEEGEVCKSNTLSILLHTFLETGVKTLYVVRNTFQPTRIKLNIH